MKKLSKTEALSVTAHLDLPRKSGNGEVQLLIFSLGHPEAAEASQNASLFAINIFKIREVIKQYQLILPPQQDKRLFGLLSLRGEWIPIINTFHIIGQTPLISDQSKPLVLIEYSRRLYGVLIHTIAGIDGVLWKDIHSIQTTQEESSLMIGVGHSKRFGDFMLLDIDKCIVSVFPDVVDIEMKDLSLSLKKNEIDEYRDCHVFFADDSSTMRKHIVQGLSLLKTNIHIFENGLLLFHRLMTLKEEDLSQGKMRANPLYLVVTDIEMPEMDGISLVKRIKSDSFYTDMPTIIYSSLSIVTSRQIGIDVVADDVIQKLNTATLVKTVMKHLDAMIQQ